MRTPSIFMYGWALIISAMLLMPPEISAQDYLESEQTQRFSKEELVQMLAPIALYPDSLIAQMLMASTYPLEVVDAERWLRQNMHLKGDDLNTALQEKTWDPSIKVLCHFPDVLFAMSDKLDQTRKLGDAFLSQQDDVMATIQELRQKARDLGNLRTSSKQQVIVEKEIIRIVPVDPTVVYVPVYDPLYVYGPWWYPAYPPYYWYYPRGIVHAQGFVSFGPHFFIGLGLFSWTWFDWHVHHIYIDTYKTRRFHRYHYRHDSHKYIWKHQPRHRKGVAYRDRKTAERFRSRPRHVSSYPPEIRGYPSGHLEKKGERPRSFEHKTSAKPQVKAEGKRIQPHVSSPVPKTRGYTTKGLGKDERPRISFERKAVTKSQTKIQTKRIQPHVSSPVSEKRGYTSQKIQRAPARYNTFTGIGSGNFERKASERGRISRGNREISRSSWDAGRQGGERQGGVKSRGSGRDSGRRR